MFTCTFESAARAPVQMFISRHQPIQGSNHDRYAFGEYIEFTSLISHGL